MSLPAVWGASSAEVDVRVLADALVGEPRQRWVRGVSCRADPASVWRWVCQLTVAPYSYDLVDNLGRRSPRTLTPGADDLHIGQRLLIGFVIDSFTPGEHLTLRLRRRGSVVGEFAMTYAVVPESVTLTRLVCTIVVGGASGPLARAVRRALAWGDLIMMRRQLRTLALRARECSPVPGHGQALTRP